jgi:hypothetical protein
VRARISAGGLTDIETAEMAEVSGVAAGEGGDVDVVVDVLTGGTCLPHVVIVDCPPLGFSLVVCTVCGTGPKFLDLDWIGEHKHAPTDTTQHGRLPSHVSR